MNPLNTQVQEELRTAAHSAAGNDEVKAVVVYGGEKVFAAGADIAEFTTQTYADMVARAGALSGAFDAVARIPKPVVAAITGYALGGGCELALACDWRVGGGDAQPGPPPNRLRPLPRARGPPPPGPPGGPAQGQGLVFSRPVGG